MDIDEAHHHFARRSSSAWAKYADAFFRISFARRSSASSRSSCLDRARSSVVSLGRWPASRLACRTQPRSVSAPSSPHAENLGRKADPREHLGLSPPEAPGDYRPIWRPEKRRALILDSDAERPAARPFSTCRSLLRLQRGAFGLEREVRHVDETVARRRNCRLWSLRNELIWSGLDARSQATLDIACAYSSRKTSDAVEPTAIGLLRLRLAPSNDASVSSVQPPFPTPHSFGRQQSRTSCNCRTRA